MIIFRVAQGTAWTPGTAGSDFTINGMPGRPENISIIQFQTSSQSVDGAPDPVNTLQPQTISTRSTP